MPDYAMALRDWLISSIAPIKRPAKCGSRTPPDSGSNERQNCNGPVAASAGMKRGWRLTTEARLGEPIRPF